MKLGILIGRRSYHWLYASGGVTYSYNQALRCMDAYTATNRSISHQAAESRAVGCDHIVSFFVAAIHGPTGVKPDWWPQRSSLC